MGKSGGSHQQGGETKQFNWPFLHLSIIQDKNLNWKAIVLHPCTVLICLPIREGLNEFINHKCKAAVLGLYFKLYICVIYTTQAHIPVYSFIQ